MFSPAERYATGIRNAEGLAVDSTGRGIFSTQHGRDQLQNNWPDLYQPEQEATLLAEELLRVTPGGDYGWPECYYDAGQRKLVLAPEYGGDGGKAVGVCARKLGPVAAFPAHWAPNDLLLYVADDVHGRIYRIVYHEGAGGSAAAAITPCPNAHAPAGPMVVANAKPPEGLDPNAGAGSASKLPAVAAYVWSVSQGTAAQ